MNFWALLIFSVWTQCTTTKRGRMELDENKCSSTHYQHNRNDSNKNIRSNMLSDTFMKNDQDVHQAKTKAVYCWEVNLSVKCNTVHQHHKLRASKWPYSWINTSPEQFQHKTERCTLHEGRFYCTTVALDCTALSRVCQINRPLTVIVNA